MILRTPDYYKNFKCIAGACPDSCCQGWEVDADESSLEYYKTLSGDIRKRIDSVLDKDEFGNVIFTLTDNKRCPFLNCENLCDMHIAIGGEHTPYTCRTFPRYINDFGATREMGISFSCPVASDIIFTLNGRVEYCDELNDLPPQLNDIDAQTYFYLVKARKKAFDIVYDRSISVKERMIKLLDYATQLQKELEEYDEGGEEISFPDVFRNPELINPEWTAKIDASSPEEITDDCYNENIMSYFIFRYFLTSALDYDVLSKVKMAVVGVLILSYFGADSWTIHLWSKETEHSQYNMDRYKHLLKNADCLTTTNLINLINEL